MTVLGLDVSATNGHVAWDQVTKDPASYSFAIARCTTGCDPGKSVDAQWAWNWRAIKAAGLIRGSYHVMHPHLSATAQAEMAARVLLGPAWGGGYGVDDLPPALDVELPEQCSGAQVVDSCVGFCRRLTSLTGRRVTIYTGKWFWEKIGNPIALELGALDLWLAAYVDRSVVGRFLPRPWGQWILWQRSGDNGAHNAPGTRVLGCAGPVDVSEFKGELDVLQQWIASSRIGPASSAETVPSLVAVTTEPGLALGDNGAATPLGRETRSEDAAAEKDGS